MSHSPFRLLCVSLFLLVPILATSGDETNTEARPEDSASTPASEAPAFDLPPIQLGDRLIRLGDDKAAYRVQGTWIAEPQRAPGICLASDPTCLDARELAAIPCTTPESCQPLHEYRRIWGEPGIRWAPSPAAEPAPASRKEPEDR